MTNHPRYSPPPPPGRRPIGPEHAAPGYPGAAQRPGAYPQQPYDWRYTTQQHATQQHTPQQYFRAPYDPYRGAPQPLAGQSPQKRSRAGALTAGAVAIAVVSAGIGGGTALLVQPDGQSATSSIGGAAPSVPAASLPSGTVEQVAAKVVPSVVKLETDMGRASEEGSGVILSSDGLILTNNHVVSAAQAAPGGGPAGGPTKVTFSNGRTTSFTVVGTDPSSDIAVVKAQGVSNLTPIAIGSSSDLRVGQDVIAVGSPLGLEGTVTTGIISALNRPVAASGDARNQNTVLDAIQTDAAINPGNSGGALVNMNAELIGINSAIATLGADAGPQAQSGSIGLGFAIPVDQAKRIADELIKNGTAAHASLGVQVGTDASIDGARIVEVVDGGAAAAAGLPSGVVVTKVDDRVISSADALVAAIRSRAPGDKVTLSYLDPSGKTRSVQVTLGKAQQ
ncbi:S1C family serine protease [Mycolicibacterium celeriflavum]|uniref:Peptidase S1 n=1 Tax=Mycolicibacterium celeriflavum TaxID=1249101 RepID=A0A1X0BRE2_MYCCF|nr:trypsin-like peptidase domain-containing protein [Mycolicibacterium celeriflavum]MCV7237423.1 trypsin-like peptidase domain-containing protein [Mycolicibacterium celeriflavum]ORA46042.1 peptidase S1 [Mycolicibacterium celeriflavum]BBY45942.1 peptidase S1 [Mycolicibacterium celeriflavum]